MMSFIRHAWVVGGCLFLTSCQPEDVWLVDVSVLGLPDAVRSLEVSILRDGKSAEDSLQVVTHHLSGFVVQLPSDSSRALQLKLLISGLDESGCQVAQGTGTTLLAGRGRRPLEVRVALTEPGCHLRLNPSGKGQGTVTLDDGIAARSYDASSGPMDYDYPGRTTVTLTAKAANKSYFGGWFGDCRGHASTCTIDVAATRRVQVDFLGECMDTWCPEEWPVPTAGALQSLWGTSATSVFSVGAGGTILHGDGIRWEKSKSDWNGKQNLNAVWSKSADDAVWVAGDEGTILRGERSPEKGISFAAVQVPAGIGDLYGIWGSAADDIWAVGAGGTILHWTKERWTSEPSPVSTDLKSVWGSGAADIWAVGSGGTILHWNGHVWMRPSVDSRFADFNFNGVGGLLPDVVWAVGDRGVILSRNGNAWSQFPSNVSVTLYAVFGTPWADLWIVGDKGTVLKLDGNALVRIGLGAGTNLRSIWGASPLDFWAAGEAQGMLVPLLRYRPAR